MKLQYLSNNQRVKCASRLCHCYPAIEWFAGERSSCICSSSSLWSPDLNVAILKGKKTTLIASNGSDSKFGCAVQLSTNSNTRSLLTSNFFFQAPLHTNILSSKLRFCFCTELEETLRSWNSEVFRLADEKEKRKFSRYRHVACNHKRNTLLTAFSTKARIFLKCQSLSRRHLKNRPISSGLNVSSSL